MSDIYRQDGEDGGTAPNLHEYSVTELSSALKRSVEDAFGHVRVRGEISGFKRAASGHLYMTLKDEKAVLDAVCWKGTAARLRFAPEDGLEVVCTGKLTTYAGRSKYQIVVETMEPAGEGALMALLEERRRKLAAEGLFDSDRKRELPYLPGVIGVVTSPTGAVIRDILHRLADRFPRRVLVWPVLVQGDGAAAQITAAIEGFNALAADGAIPRPDVIIVARGGGSLEDLWAFNEENVVRAAAASGIPLISAVGHETDTTLIDHASDLRAPTPTAAAELVVPVRADLRYTLVDFERRLIGGLGRLVREQEARLQGLLRALRDPRDAIGAYQQRLDELAERLPRALMAGIEARARGLGVAAAGLRPNEVLARLDRHRAILAESARRLTEAMKRGLVNCRTLLDSRTEMLASLSYERVLNRGYAVVRSLSGGIVEDASATSGGMELAVQFRDGRVGVTVDGGGAKPGPPAKKPRAKKPAANKTGPDGPASQGKLF